MIQLGLRQHEKVEVVERYCRSNAVDRVVVVSPGKFSWPESDIPCAEVVEYSQTIEYAVFYRLLQEVGRSTLVVINECLRTQDRNNLTYNCIRHFLNQAGHQLVFQYLPIIAGIDDLYILLDFDTKSKWKRERRVDLLRESEIVARDVGPRFNAVSVLASDALMARYTKTRDGLFDKIELRDPHTIPRNLVLLSGKEKAAGIGPGQWYTGRNKRLKLERMQTYRDTEFSHGPYSVFEPPHRFIDMADFVCLSGQRTFDYLMTDLKVEQWYFDRYQEWAEEIQRVYSVIQQNKKRS